ncbi:MAG: class I SAM-dependent methyltransferase [Lentisphaerae bacterium]|jgi:tRNA (cmo5U34)-methyltransferase|nr:class I SAM-dependent methyltransferase [Lentisphaerota bacterium]MBT5607464.1 class I SAM-dependent methyltransferase [Lentisphaerota bacterium]MBT7055744.1 class I SAM-dependent methyltransferase [Lentisphaerota bacterium]MBT7843121.1 class I SAM-dependent methyltransferase [Lentisphaerota bacterium]
MDQIDQNRFQSMAYAYDQMAPHLVPFYDFLQDRAIDALQLPGNHPTVVIDLGAGSGRLLEKILQRDATATGVWVDSSDAFRDVAERRLARFGSRVHWVLNSLENSWQDALPGPPNGIVSMSAIHHLTDLEKRELYTRCFEVLDDDGVFVNMDEMKSISQEAYVASLHYWGRHVETACRNPAVGNRPEAKLWVGHFDRWRERNITNIDVPKQKGDDLHATFSEQLNWLAEAGFRDTDLFAKVQLWCGIVGRK